MVREIKPAAAEKKLHCQANQSTITLKTKDSGPNQFAKDAGDFVKQIVFQSKRGAKYSYNDCSGMIFPLQSGAIEKIQSESGNYLGISAAKSECAPKTVTPAEVQSFVEKNSFNQLILEMTACCNLQCKYCIYGEHYPSTRTSSSRNMDFSTAKAAVNYYMANFKRKYNRNPNASPSVGFYGGEPLLQFEMIRQVVEYIEENFSFYPDIKFTITTNGLLLSDSVRRYLVAHDFAVIVSLDGYKENHDRNRVTPTGATSFDKVYANIKAFQHEFPDYGKFGISACYDYRTDLLQMDDFFRKENLFIIKLSQVSGTNTTYYDDFTEKEKRRHFDQYEILKNRFFDTVKNGRLPHNSLLFPLFGTAYAEFAFHPMIREKRPTFSPYTAACIPGDKIYVTADGNFHMCERVPHDMPIGSIASGLDYTTIATLISRYNERVCDDCPSCPMTKVCGLCYAVVRSGGDFVCTEGYCNAAGIRTEKMLTDMVELLEVNPELLEDVTVDYYRTVIEKAGHIVE